MSKFDADVKTGVFDPSHRVDGKYWQWTNVKIDDAWNDVARQVHKGWPDKIGDFGDQHAILYGIMNFGPDGLWLYRVFPAGRDSFGRRGRYFFVLFKLSSPEEITSPRVSDFIHYFETERSLPLKTTPLDLGVPSTAPDTMLQKLAEQWRNRGHSAHWGMDERGSVVEFARPAAKPAMTAPLPAQAVAGGSAQQGTTMQRVKLILGLIAAIVLSGYGMHFFYELGYSKGFDRGSDESGYDEGHKEGYIQGYDAGMKGRKRGSMNDDPSGSARPDLPKPTPGGRTYPVSPPDAPKNP
jgi:hypothetical protein